VAVPVRALPKLDSSHLDRFERERVARQAFVVRGGRVASLRATVRDGPVVLLDDVLTTGATLAAVTVRLREVGIDVSFAAVLAATRLRHAAT
jgi:predicted amidophosphoribosyltransferase